MLQVTHVEVGSETVEVRLCLWCRRKGADETIDARARMQGKETGPAPDAT